MWSRIREAVVGDGKPRVSGHIAYRAVLKREDVPAHLWSDDVTLWGGEKTHLVHYPLRRGELFNLVAVFHSNKYDEGWNTFGDTAELTERFADACPQVKELLAKIETWKMWVLCDREPVKNWTDRRVTLLGDAAHPMLPVRYDAPFGQTSPIFSYPYERTRDTLHQLEAHDAACTVGFALVACALVCSRIP